MIQVLHIDHVALSVRDLSASEAWYRRHLGLERRHADLWDGPPVMMGAGDTCLALFQAEGGEGGGTPAVRVLHLAFRTDAAGFRAARLHLKDEGIAHREVQHENCWSLYFADPDGHKLEVTSYEEP